MKRYFFTLTGKVVAAFVVISFLGLLPGCKYYYKVMRVNRVTLQDMKKCDSLDKYVILHQGKSAWHMAGLKVHDMVFSANLVDLPIERQHYKSRPAGTKNRYKIETQSDVIDQVHLYPWDSLVPRFAAGDTVILDPTTIRRAEVYSKSKGKTTASFVVPAVVVTVSAGVLALGIAAIVEMSTKSSCPLIYVQNGNDFAFAGEIFGGSVFSSLERHDYLPLPGFRSSENRYTLKISNELPEIQYINLAELWIVSHPENVAVLPDRQGIVHTIGKPEPPLEATSLAKSNLLPLLAHKDQRFFRFDEDPAMTGDSCAFNTVFLTFPVPGNSDTGKLMVSAGNSLWGDYTYLEFSKLFGKRYGDWIKKQGRKPAEKNIQWKQDQRFTMMVSLETAAGWEFVDYFDLIGPLGARDMIMPVGLGRALISTSADGTRKVRIKLESGFKLWDLDYAAMDFSRDTVFTTTHVSPTSAITETGKDVKLALTENDAAYYIQEEIGEEGLVTFPDIPATPGMKKSVFLHAKGYYEPVRDYKNPPDREQLRTFLVPGRFSRFSYDNYTVLTKNHREPVSEPIVP